MAVTSGGNGINVENTPFINRPTLPYSSKRVLLMKVFIASGFERVFLAALV
jgi:hypothetical protein